MEINDALLQYGALGVLSIVGLLAARMMFNRLQSAADAELARMQSNYERERERADRLEGQLQSLNGIVRNDYVTTIQGASLAIAEANRAVADALAAVRRN